MKGTLITGLVALALTPLVDAQLLDKRPMAEWRMTPEVSGRLVKEMVDGKSEITKYCIQRCHTDYGGYTTCTDQCFGGR